MKKIRWLGFIAITVTSLVMAYVFRDFVRDEMIVPIVYVLWIIQLYIESVPQVFIWVFLIVIALILLAKGLFRVPKQRLSRGVLYHSKMGPVETWLEWIERSKRGRYFKSRLSRRLSELTIDSLAFEKRAAESDIERGLQHGVLDIPEDLQRYLRQGLERESWGTFYGSFESLRSWLGRQREAFGDMELAEVVTKLELALKRGSVDER